MNAELASLQRYHQHGDAMAFQALVQAHAGMVFATARRVTRDAARAEEVAQETFLELARSAARITESVGAWLHRVAWRKARDVVRADVTRRHYEEAAGVQHQIHTECEATWEELEPLIDEAIEELPDKLREPLMQHFFFKRSQQELAAMLGVNQSTVSRLLDSGIAELRSRLHGKHAICGGTLAVLLGANATQAAPASLTATLGKLAISGTGASTSSTPTTTVATTLLAMNATKLILTTVAAAALLGAPFMFFLDRPGTGSTKSKAASPPKKPAPTAAVQRVTKPSVPVQTGEPAHYRPPPVSDEVRQEVDAIIRRHKNMSPDQIAQSAELKELWQRYHAVLNRLESTPEFTLAAQERIKMIQSIKGAGNGKLDMDLDMGRPTAENLGEPLIRSWLEAAVSQDPERVQEWVFARLEGAIFEFGVDAGLEKTSEGIKVHGKTAETTAKPDVEE